MALSTFTWLDHREDDAERVREALAAFDERGMIDPLGFGVVRDAFSEMLFPGISTIQTRARYFLFVPWIYMSLDDDGVVPDDGTRVAREREVALIEALLRGSDSHEGIIGRFARQSTQQLPSAIYWGGLGRWGIRCFDGTRLDYVASLAARRRANRSSELADEPRPTRTPWHPGLPSPPDGLLEGTTLALTEDEAAFLQGRILEAAPDTYLALLVRDGSSTQVADLPWEHPLAPTAPPEVRRQLHHARFFSLATWGAGLIYNYELSRLLVRDGGKPLPTDHDAALAAWVDRMAQLRDELVHWDRDELWLVVHAQYPQVPWRVRLFVDWWLDRVIDAPAEATTSTQVREELRRREVELKGARAKLANRRARELAPSAQGDNRMSFRWPQASRMLADIHRGLEGLKGKATAHATSRTLPEPLHADIDRGTEGDAEPA